MAKIYGLDGTVQTSRLANGYQEFWGLKQSKREADKPPPQYVISRYRIHEIY
jgi:hypothetical protein